MDRQQAAQEVIKLKKEWANSPNQDQVAQRAAQLRQQYGLDEKMYGADVSLADAYSNYAREFGQGVNHPGQQQAPQQMPQQPSFNQEEQMRKLQEMMMQNSSSYFDAQKAQFDKMLNDQISQLEMAYAEAVNQGKLSVNEAKEQFEAQKSQLEKSAYQQAEATKAYGNEMGIQHSQQMVGLQQGDNARFNSLHNENANIRDKRINDIRDRINLITKQKDLDIARSNAEYGYNIAGAQAQAQQMYAQQMADLMGKDYFTQMGMQHDINMQDRQFDQRVKEMALQHGYDLDKMDINQMYQQANMKYQNILDMDKMKFGHDLDLEKIDIQFKNRLTEMATQFGYNTKLESQRHNNAIKQAADRFSRESQAAHEAYKESMRRQARSLGLPDDATEKQISDALRAQGREDLELQAKFELEKAIQNSASMAAAEFEINSILYNPDLELDPQKPKDPKENWGLVGRFLSGYKGKLDKYNEEYARKKAAEDALQRWLNKNGVGN